MRTDATVNPEIFFEPITWALHNKIVDLADEPLRGRGHGNYIPALKEAYNLLTSYELSENCANLLFFLSDGRPSDNVYRKGEDMLSIHQEIVDFVGLICSEFKSRLIFGAIGFAQDDGDMFHLIKRMV